MIKRDVLILLFVTSSIVIGLYLWLIKDHNISDKTTALIEESRVRKQVTVVDEEISPHNSIEKSLILPRFKLMSTDTQNIPQALLAVNQKALQWFQTGDSIIDNYVVHNINDSYVTLFDGKGTYYEIYLFEPHSEDESSDESDASNIETDLNTRGIDTNNMIPLGDGQYISYGDKDVSGDTDEMDEMAFGVEEVDTSGQTIIYRDEDVSQQVDLDDKIYDGQVDTYDSGQTITYGTKDVSQDIDHGMPPIN